jgi:hypothetical protein
MSEDPIVNEGEENPQGESMHMKEIIECYNLAIDKAIPVQKDINDIKRDILKSTNDCIKEGFGRAPAEFKLVSGLLYDLDGQEEDLKETKLFKTLEKVKNIVEFMHILGHKAVLDKVFKELGVSCDLLFDTADTLGKPDTGNHKFIDNYSSLFGDVDEDGNEGVPEDGRVILQNLVRISMEFQKKIDDYTSFINNDLADAVKNSTRISKSTFKKGVAFKMKVDYDDGVEDKIHDITESNLLENSAFESLIYSDEDEPEITEEN